MHKSVRVTEEGVLGRPVRRPRRILPPPSPPPPEIRMLTLLIAFSTFSDFPLLLKINDGYCLQEIPSVHRKQMDKLRNTRSP